MIIDEENFEGVVIEVAKVYRQFRIDDDYFESEF